MLVKWCGDIFMFDRRPTPKKISADAYGLHQNQNMLFIIKLGYKLILQIIKCDKSVKSVNLSTAYNPKSTVIS